MELVANTKSLVTGRIKEKFFGIIGLRIPGKNLKKTQEFSFPSWPIWGQFNGNNPWGKWSF